MSKIVSAPSTLDRHTDKRDITGSDFDNVAKRGLDVSVLNSDPFGDYDRIDATYPSDVVEIYTYKLEGVSIGTIEVTYTEKKKKLVLSVVKNGL